MTPLIRILCDGGGVFGFGNLKRSTTLGWGFAQAGYRVRVEAVSDLGRALLPEAPNDPGEANLWILDLPYNGDRWVLCARDARKRVAALDYEGNLAPDIVISIFERETAPVARHQVVGLEYAIIRPDVATLSPAYEGTGVVVVIGGGESDGLGASTARTLYDAGQHVVLIEGPLTSRTHILPCGIIRLSSPPDMGARMAGSAWGVTSGGGTMLEMLCLGKAVHVLPRTYHEAALARKILDSGGLLGIGGDSLQVPDDATRARVARTARALVDGNGVKRIVEIGETLL